MNTEKCSNRESPPQQLKSYRDGRNLTHKQWRGPATWKDMLKNAWNDTANWQTRKWSNFRKYRIRVWMITDSSRKNSNHLENCQKFAVKLSYNVCFWHALVDLTFCGRYTNWHEQSQTGQDHVKDDWLVCYRQYWHVGKYSTALQIGTLPRLRLCW